MTKPTYDDLVECLHETHKLLHEMLALSSCTFDDTHRLRLGVVYNAGDMLHAAGHVEHNPRVRLSQMFEKLARAEVGTIDSTIIVGEIDWSEAAELILEAD